MNESGFGFDDFARKWVPEPPAWERTAGRWAWLDAGTEDGRRRAYLDTMERAGGDAVAFGRDVRDRVRRDAAAGIPILDLLDGLLRAPEVGTPESAALLFQRVFGVPASRAGFIASWRPSNRTREAERVLERVVLCVEDARRAGLWSPPEAA